MIAWLKGLSKRLPYPIFLRLFLLKWSLVERRRHRQEQKASRIESLESIDLARYRRSDTLFILGSGPSINRISAERWQAIAQHDTVGFNFWLCHSYLPTFYFYERIDATTFPNLYRG